MKKLKVMYIINNLELGGAEKVLLLLLTELSKRKDLEITVVSLEGTGPLEAELTKLPIKLKKFHYHLFAKFIHRFDPYFRIGLYFYVKSENPDILHGQLMMGEDFAKCLGGLLGIPVITTLHDLMIHPGRRQKYLNKYLTKAVAVSEPAADYLAQVYGIPLEKISVIPDAINMKDFIGSKKVFNPKKPVFTYVGRIFRHKGLEYAIKGLAKLINQYPGLEFQIYGDAKFEQETLTGLKDIVLKNKWEFVKFMGTTTDVPIALKKGDIFILPSKSEGFSLAILEAAAASKPIISTKTGAIPEMVQDGISGYFVKYGSPEDIYVAASKVLASDVEAMGQLSYEMVKDKFSIEKVAKMYYNLYSQVITEAGLGEKRYLSI